MKTTIRIVIFISIAAIRLFADTKSAERESWFSERRAMISRAKETSDDQAIIDLSRIVRGVGDDLKNASPEAKELYFEARSLLLSIPGHAIYYQDKIESLRAEVLANAKKSDDEIGRMQDNGEQVVHVSDFESFGSMIAFPTLRLLPSAESVAVLGFYLNDPVGRDGKTLVGGYRHRPGDDFPPSSCNAEMAAGAMRNLGIEKPPFTRSAKAMSDQEVDAWKNWWNEVNDGRRTYRFIGSPIEYGLDGPASSELIQRAQRNMKRDAERSAGHKKAPAITEPASVISQISKPYSIAAILAACALVAAAGWYFLRGRKAV